ncbi:MAG TPA: alcohol dehydrogenase, partial [Peptococcaceae bacterium]|nr:alcohol dehydrogenase [Peptococcaceae bacterium]
MKAMVLREPAPIEDSPLVASEVPEPDPGPGEIRIKVRACGICHTDLHIIEGDLPPARSPVIPG